jgi:hypothetical protein
MRTIPKTMTPVLTRSLVAAMLDAGYIEQEAHYPVVAELPTGFMYILYNDVEDNFLISEFVTTGRHPDFSWNPIGEFGEFSNALAAFRRIYAEKLIP